MVGQNSTKSVPMGRTWLLVVAVIAAVALGVWCVPALRHRVVGMTNGSAAGANGSSEGEEAHDHGGHDHSHAGHDETNSLELSPQARRNIGLTDEMVRPVELQTFFRKLTVPAMVVEQAGRTKIQVAAPMSGLVAAVHVIQGEAISPGRPLFRLRLTHEDLVAAQTMYLKTLGELDVIRREIARLQEITNQGAVAGKVLLEKQYQEHKAQAVLNAYRESLQLHGLTEEQIDQIAKTRRLLREVSITAPSYEEVIRDRSKPGVPTPRRASYVDKPSRGDAAEPAPFFLVQRVSVEKGKFVAAGEQLGVLADFSELYIEGKAFEQDASDLVRAARSGMKVTAVPEDSQDRTPIEGLEIVYVDNEVDPDSRSLYFYVRLPNEILYDRQRPDGHRFVTWRFKPGQRMQLLVPVEEWADRIVLPVDAVAQEGAEYFVFQENGDHFDRRPVHVEYRDQFFYVIANDGSIFPGDRVAMTGAHQMQMALKNKAGGGVDPHAGHNH